MSPTKPLISVIMAVFNGDRYLAEALGSIVQQGYAPLEIIVVDDGSTDHSADVVQQFAAKTDVCLRYAYQPNRGQPAAQNYGVRMAQGAVIAFLDCDDLWPTDKLSTQLPRLVGPFEHPTQAPGIVLGKQHRYADGANVNMSELERANNRPVHYSLGSSLFASWVFDRVGEFDEALRYSADWDWFVRAQELAIPMVEVQQVTVLVRVHAHNMTRQRAEGAPYAVRMVRKHLDHLRVSQGRT